MNSPYTFIKNREGTGVPTKEMNTDDIMDIDHLRELLSRSKITHIPHTINIFSPSMDIKKIVEAATDDDYGTLLQKLAGRKHFAIIECLLKV